MKSDGILRRTPQLVDGRRPMLTRHELLVWAGKRRIEIRHAQTGQSHIFKIGGSATISGRKHQTGSCVLFDGADVGHGILVDLQSRHARRVGERFRQHIDHCAVGHIRGAFRVDLLRFLRIAGRNILHGFLGIIIRLDHDSRIELAGKRHQRTITLSIVYGIPHGRLVSHDGGETLGPGTDSTHLHRIQREEQSGKQNQQQAHNRIQRTRLLVVPTKQLAMTSIAVIQKHKQ